MRLLINAVSVKEGGSLVVLSQTMRQLSVLRPDWDVHVVASAVIRDQLNQDFSATIHTVGNVERSGARLRLWYETGLLKLVEELHPNILHSQTNYLPVRGVACPSLLLVQHAGHFSTVFDQLTRQAASFSSAVNWSLKRRWVHRSVRNADVLTVQTKALARDIVSCLPRLSKKQIRVIPHGCGQVSQKRSQPLAHPAIGRFCLGYTTKFGVQKNFDVLLKAVQVLHKSGQPIELVLTLDPSYGPNQRILNRISELGIDECVQNYGESTGEELVNIYSSLDGFAFPTLCESFGFPLTEAMAFALPVLVADTEVNIEVADAKPEQIFPSHDHEILAARIKELMLDPALYRSLSQASIKRSSELSWDKSGQQVVELMESMAAVDTVSTMSDRK